MTASGNVGIGTASPNATFNVRGGANISGSVNLATLEGNVGIGTTAPKTKLDVNGNGSFAGSLHSNDFYSASGTRGLTHGIVCGGLGNNNARCNITLGSTETGGESYIIQAWGNPNAGGTNSYTMGIIYLVSSFTDYSGSAVTKYIAKTMLQNTTSFVNNVGGLADMNFTYGNNLTSIAQSNFGADMLVVNAFGMRVDNIVVTRLSGGR